MIEVEGFPKALVVTSVGNVGNGVENARENCGRGLGDDEARVFAGPGRARVSHHSGRAERLA